MLDNANEQMQLSEAALHKLRVLLDEHTADGAIDDLDSTREQIEKTEDELARAADAALSHAQRIALLNEQLAAIDVQKTELLTQLRTAQAEAEAAGRSLRFMESPFAPHKLVDWLLSRGPKILGVLLIMGSFWWLLRFLGRRMIRGVIRRSRSGNAEEREERAQRSSAFSTA